MRTVRFKAGDTEYAVISSCALMVDHQSLLSDMQAPNNDTSRWMQQHIAKPAAAELLLAGSC